MHVCTRVIDFDKQDLSQIICNKEYPSHNDLNEHKKNDHGLNNLKCWACNESFEYYIALRHVIRHDGIRYPVPSDYVYQCDFENCEIKFASKDKMLIHKGKHTGQKPKFCCGYCGKAFDDTYQKNKHETNSHIKKEDFVKKEEWKCTKKIKSSFEETKVSSSLTKSYLF